jgi:hypothetical protein
MLWHQTECQILSFGPEKAVKFALSWKCFNSDKHAEIKIIWASDFNAVYLWDPKLSMLERSTNQQGFMQYLFNRKVNDTFYRYEI